MGCVRNSTAQRVQVPNAPRHSQDHQHHHFTQLLQHNEQSDADRTHAAENDHPAADNNNHNNQRQPENSEPDRQLLENSRGVGEVLQEEQEQKQKQAVVECLRRVPSAELVRAQAEVVLEAQRHALLFPFAPVLDGRVLRPEDDPLHATANTSAAASRARVRVPLLAGLNAAEMSTPLLYELAHFFGHELRGDPRQLTYADVGEPHELDVTAGSLRTESSNYCLYC